MISVLIGLVLVSDMNPNVGTSGFNFLKVPPTAREAAMGNVAIGFSDNAFGIWYNPAGLAAQKGRQVGVGYISHVAGVQSGTVAFSAPLPLATVGIGGYYVNSGPMKRTDENGGEYGSFSASYLDLDVAASKRFLGLAVGLGVKAIYGTIDSFWTLGLGGDLGISYEFPASGLRAGAAARNLGISVKPFRSQNDKLPTDLAVGVGYEPISGLRLGLEAHQPLDNNLDVRLGAEGWLNKYVCLRAGLTTAGGDLKSGGGTDILAGLSAGFGVRWHLLELDYSFTPMVILGNGHRVSFRISL
jgi:hypothetical protein